MTSTYCYRARPFSDHVTRSHVNWPTLATKWRQCFCLVVCLTGAARGQTTAELTGSEESLIGNSNIPVALVTIVVLGVCIVIGILIAKGVEHCYDRRAIRDDASDISEFTKGILKAQFMFAFNKKLIGNVKARETVRQRARRLGRIWVAKARRNLNEQHRDDDSPPEAGGEVVLVSVKVVGGSGTAGGAKDARAETSGNANNNQGTARGDSDGKDESDESKGSPRAGKKTTTTAKNRARRVSPTRGKHKATGSPRRKKRARKGKKKKKKRKATKSEDGAGKVKDDGDGKEESDSSDGSGTGDSDVDTDTDTDRGDRIDDVTNAREATASWSHGRGPSSRDDGPAERTRRDSKRPSTTPRPVDVEKTGSECSSRDDYEFLANTSRVARKKRPAEEAWVSNTGPSPTAGYTSGTRSKLSMSVDSALL